MNQLLKSLRTKLVKTQSALRLLGSFHELKEKVKSLRPWSLLREFPNLYRRFEGPPLSVDHLP